MYAAAATRYGYVSLIWNCFNKRTVHFRHVFSYVFINSDLFHNHSLLTVLFHRSFEAVCIPLSPRALWWTGLSCSRLSVLCAVLWKLPRLVSIFMCHFSTWKQPLPWPLLPRRHNVRNDWIYDCLFFWLCIFLSYIFNYYVSPFNLSSAPKPGPSFQSPVMSAPLPVNVYVQGSPIYTSNDQYFTIPQVSCVYVLFNTACFEIMHLLPRL